MEWINYHHLLYFWTVAREGGVARASAALRLASPTVSAQVRMLERALGSPLFTRVGRGLVLTDTGRLVYGYADRIFRLGQELMGAVREGGGAEPLTLVVGVTHAMPKLVVYRVLQPVLRLPRRVHLVCREDRPDRLLADLAVHAVDVVLTDAPEPATARVRVFHHPLGECGLTFFAEPRLAAPHRRRFPRSLDGAPVLLPRETSAVRGALEHWFEDVGVRPRIAGEFDDSALLNVFGQRGLGIFAAPSIIETEIRRQYGVHVIGRVDAVRERFYAIALERRLTHPALLAMRSAARERLFD